MCFLLLVLRVTLLECWSLEYIIHNAILIDILSYPPSHMSIQMTKINIWLAPISLNCHIILHNLAVIMLSRPVDFSTFNRLKSQRILPIFNVPIKNSECKNLENNL